jgi:hypothetical protein
VVRLSISKELVEGSPAVEDGELDRRAVAAHYGLAEGEDAPETEGEGERRQIIPSDPHDER